ncbi:unnamed protein product [Auanema sp. JU1783]|nr:unnamed protein product [Auanema sp. JU1783]
MSSWDSFCGGALTGSPFNTGVPNVSVCFQHTILVWIPFLFVALLAPVFIFQSRLNSKRYISLPWSRLFLFKLLICFILIAVNVFTLVYNIVKNDTLAVDKLYPSLLIVTYIIICGEHLVRRKTGMVTSGIQHLSALMLAICGAPEFYQRVREGHENKGYLDSALTITYLAYYPILIIYTVTLCFADPRSPHEKAQRSIELDCSFINRLTLWWYNPVPFLGAKKSLEIDDIFELNEGSTTPYLTELWNHHWAPRLAAYREQTSIWAKDKSTAKEVPLPSVVATLFFMFKWEVLTASALKICSDTLQFANPFLLHEMIGFVSDTKSPLWLGLSYSILMFVTSECRSFLLNAYFYIMFRMGIKFQTALTAAVYKKTLTLSNSARRDKTVGEIVNLMAIDIERFQLITPQIQQFWSCPYQITLALIYLYITLGYSAAPGIVIMIIFLPLNIICSMIIKNWQTEQMKLKDQRTKMVNEVLNGMKVVKLYAWEVPMEQYIDDIRQRELSLIKKSSYVRNTIDAFNTASPFVVALFSFGTYVLSNKSHELTPQVAFVSLTLFNQLRSPMTMIAYLISQTVQAVVSNKRLKDFFVADELDPAVVEKQQADRTTYSVDVKDVDASWEGDLVEPGKETLRDISFEIPRGTLFAVVGKVGAGKSSLLSALLGEMGKLKGRIGVSGKLAYVPQQPWIQNMSVRDNITFGKPFDKKRYNMTLHACALKPDLKILPYGDMTEIGEKGINLSGGQKARISLARAVYQDYDVYLLDDPLSAVDAHVGRHIFEKVIGPDGILKNKTRILVTHGLTYVKSADEIVVLQEGVIAEHGSYNQLMSNKSIFFDFVEDYKSKDEDDDSSVASGEETDRVYKEDVDVGDVDVTSDCKDKGSCLDVSKQGDQDEKKKLIQKETIESGGVKLAVYNMYIQAASYVRSILFVVFLTAFLTFQVLRSFWLSAWSDSYDVPNPDVDVGQRLAVYGALGITESLCFFTCLMVLVHAGLNASRNLHGPLLHNLLRSPMSFYDTTPLGRILNRCAKDVEVVDMLLPINFRYLVMCILQVICTLIVIMISTPIFGVVIIPLAIIYYIFLKFYVPTSRQLKRLESVNRSPIYSHFGETVQGAASIRAFGKVEEFSMHSGKIVDRFIRCKYSNIVSNRWLSVRLEFIGNCIIFFAALFAVLSKEFGWVDSPGKVGVSISYAMSITEVLNFAVRQISEIEANIVAVERIEEYTHTPNEAEWKIENTKLPQDWPNEGVVSFVDYSVRYRPGLDLVLKNISANITPGEKIGIVGRTGAGKSSFALALFRLIEAAEGQIIIDGVDISKIGLHDVRGNLTIIPQDPVLFSGSLRFNLDPFNHNTDEEIWASLSSAHLKEFASSLQGGLEYPISEGGENISVGQRQLVCLARALLRKSRVLVLDEATAAVDVTTDSLIQTTIRTKFKNCTVFTIAHRLNTILDYDRIMVLDKGCIVELDSPGSLLEDKNSIFAKMVADSKNAEQQN